jgi:hypothetical protein
MIWALWQQGTDRDKSVDALAARFMVSREYVIGVIEANIPKQPRREGEEWRNN